MTSIGGEFGPLAENQVVQAESAIRDALNLPALQVPVRGFLIGKDDGLWLQRERRADGLAWWLILDADGVVVGEVGLPGAAQPIWSEGPTVWTKEPDSLGIVWLTRYTLETATN